jgi:hypothetical protein
MKNLRKNQPFQKAQTKNSFDWGFGTNIALHRFGETAVSIQQSRVSRGRLGEKLEPI